MPANEYFLIGEYKLRDEYDFSKSQLYSVAKVSKEYMIIDGSMYYPSSNMSKAYERHGTDSKTAYIFEDSDISIINNSDSNDKLLAILNLTRLKIGYRAAIHVTQKTRNKISIINIYQLRKRISQMQIDQSVKNLEIVEIPKEFIETVEIDKKIVKFLNEEYKMRLRPYCYSYWYYVDEAKGYIYCQVVYTTWSGDNGIILLRFYLTNNKLPPVIVYHLNMKYNELQKDPNILVYKVKGMMLYWTPNLLHIHELLRYKSHRQVYISNSGICYEIIYNHMNVYSYMEEVIFKIEYPMFKFVDVKHNRAKVFKYYNAEFEEVRDINVDRRYNIVMWHIQGQMERENRVVRVPFVILDLVITRKLAIDS